MARLGGGETRGWELPGAQGRQVGTAPRALPFSAVSAPGRPRRHDQRQMVNTAAVSSGRQSGVTLARDPALPGTSLGPPPRWAPPRRGAGGPGHGRREVGCKEAQGAALIPQAGQVRRERSAQRTLVLRSENLGPEPNKAEPRCRRRTEPRSQSRLTFVSVTLTPGPGRRRSPDPGRRQADPGPWSYTEPPSRHTRSLVPGHVLSPDPGLSPGPRP